MNNVDYYKTLGIGENATIEEIKKAFRKLAILTKISKMRRAPIENSPKSIKPIKP